jgi:hypothetical protein
MPNQALEQTRDNVLRYGERVGCELLNLVVMRTPSGLNGRCAVGGWMVAVSAGPFEASRSKRALSGAAAFRGGKTLVRSVNFLCGGPTEGTRWRTRLKVHSLHWILCSHNNTLHRSRRAARLLIVYSLTAAR